jgi:hypothetical protein
MAVAATRSSLREPKPNKWLMLERANGDADDEEGPGPLVLMLPRVPLRPRDGSDGQKPFGYKQGGGEAEWSHNSYRDAGPATAGRYKVDGEDDDAPVSLRRVKELIRAWAFELFLHARVSLAWLLRIPEKRASARALTNFRCVDVDQV